jgi:hypothetical protein
MQTYVQVVVVDKGGAHAQSKGLVPGGLRRAVSGFAAKKEILPENTGRGGMPEHMITRARQLGRLVPRDVEARAPVRVPHYVMRRRNVVPGRRYIGLTCWGAGLRRK